MELKEMHVMEMAVVTISAGSNDPGYSSTESDHDPNIQSLGAMWNENKIHEINTKPERISTTKPEIINSLEISIDIQQNPSTKTAPKTNTKTVGNARNMKLIMLFLVLWLNIGLFMDAHYVMDDIEYIKDLIKTTLSVMCCHLVIEHCLENIIYKIKRDDMILYSITACLRDIINNIIMTLFYIFDDYGYWWRPIMWGCYMADLVMLLSKWKYFKSNWLKFVFMHHFGVGIMLFILNHTTKMLTDNALICLIIFMNSNTPGCASPIWKAFKLPFYEWSNIICFILQRIIRFAAYSSAFNVKYDNFFKKDYCYIVLVLFALILDIWDIYSQIISIYNYYKKKQNKINNKALKTVN